MNDFVRIELLEEVAGLAAAEALERAAAPAKTQANRGLCNMLAMVGGRDVAVAALVGRIEVDENGCHLWKGIRDYNGYGRVVIKNRNFSVHRLQYEIANGPIPETGSPDGIGWMVLHKCDVPACSNPAHLYLGTAKRNAQDTADRCRIRRGHRVQSDGLNTERENERWGTVFYEIEGVIRSLHEWTEVFGLNYCTLQLRLKSGWAPASLGRAPSPGYRGGQGYTYRRFSGEAAVLEYLAAAGGG